MTKAQDHPAYEEEAQYLDLTVQHLDFLVEHFEPRSIGEYLAYSSAAAEARWSRSEHDERARLSALREDPYFARLDFCESGQTSVRKIYLGKSDIRASDGRGYFALDWRAPIAQLFYQGQFHDAQYQAPRGPVRGEVTLRRHLQVRRGMLEEISDDIPTVGLMEAERSHDLATAHEEVAHQLSDEFLLTLLEARRDNALRDIVASIQAEQDQLIRMPPDQSLIVQGVAGSGKTSVALHRLAYLLFAYHDRITPDRVLVLGPNRLFLSSIANVLPALGVQRVSQATYEDWALAWLNQGRHSRQGAGKPAGLQCDQTSELLEQFLDDAGDRGESVRLYRRSRLLGSHHMIQLLDAYLNILRAIVVAGSRPLSVRYELPSDPKTGPTLEYQHPGARVQLSLAQSHMRKLMSETELDALRLPRTLNAHRSAFLIRCVGMLWQQFTTAGEYTIPSGSEPIRRQIERSRRAAFDKAIEPLIAEQVAPWWPVQDPITCFNDLFTSHQVLERAEIRARSVSRRGFAPQELQLLAQASRTREDIWPLEAVPILLYLDLGLNGPMSPTYSHILVDEVQDMSPLQIATLLKEAPGGSLTLLGDVAQGVYSYRGISEWSELESVFGARAFRRATMVNSYRSTYEITELANAVLVSPALKKRGVMPSVPVARHGKPVVLKQLSNPEHLVLTIHADVTAMQAGGAQSIAVLCKTAKHCRQLQQLVAEYTGDTLPVIAQFSELDRPSVAIMPAYVAKGLEFDCVIVSGADSETYSEREYDTKLLYLSLTRALHELHVYWVGNIAQALGAVQRSPAGIRQTVRVRR